MGFTLDFFVDFTENFMCVQTLRSVDVNFINQKIQNQNYGTLFFVDLDEQCHFLKFKNIHLQIHLAVI